jgi:hypothetical protein
LANPKGQQRQEISANDYKDDKDDSDDENDDHGDAWEPDGEVITLNLGDIPY